MKINIQAKSYSPRLRYAADFLLGRILGFKVVYGEQPATADEEEAMCIVYAKHRSASAKVFIPAHSFLDRRDLEQPDLEPGETAGLAAFFFMPEVKGADLPFDLFAMSFYLLSRFEEYDPGLSHDEHQRFPARSSLAFQHGFLDQPLIDQWAWRLYALLKKQYPSCPERKASFRFLASIDVDFAWAYLNKGWKRSSAMFLKSLITLNWTQTARQVQVLLKLKKDPYDTYAQLKAIHQKYNVESLFFLLLGTYGPFDKNNPRKHPAMKELIRQMAKVTEVGIHPSYASNNSPELLEKEIQVLENILGQRVQCSRQHFLKLALPTSYRQLIKHGMERDYSMGYAAAPGFRASTAYPFYWYDLEKECQTTLELFPFAVMDVTLKNYLQLSPAKALEQVAHIMEQVRHSGGVFCLLWHNSSFSEEMDWEDWGEIYEKIVALGADH